MSFFVFFRSVRKKLQFTVFLDHPVVAIRLIAIRAIKHFLTGYHDECRLVERRLQKSNESLSIFHPANYKDGGEGETSLSAN